MGVSSNGGTPKSSILIGCSIINHPFWGIPIFGNPHVLVYHSPLLSHLLLGVAQNHSDNTRGGAGILAAELDLATMYGGGRAPGAQIRTGSGWLNPPPLRLKQFDVTLQQTPGT